MTPPSLEEVLADIRQLPSLPAVVGELLRVLNHESTGVDQLADGIAKDQALAACVLRVANSPFFGVQYKVASIHNAIVVLGFRAVGSLVMAATVTGFFTPPREVSFDLSQFWRHSIGTALCARVLARHVGLDPEIGFAAGLLHDIGVLMLLTTRPTHYAAVLAYREAHDCHLVEAERAVLGFDHGVAGEALAVRWRFPAEIVGAVALHHLPSAGDHPPAFQDKATLADVVHLANILAHALDLGAAPQALVPPVDPDVWRRIGLSGESLKPLLAAVEREHEGYCALLAA
jgi:putative nucleotidyltransferase with HDIG domain